MLYWRPGCAFCWMLRRGLHRAGVAIEERNIWEDTRAAAFVRSVAGSNETVPTVVVGGKALVNPSVGAVLALVDPAGKQRWEAQWRGWLRRLLTPSEPS